MQKDQKKYRVEESQLYKRTVNIHKRLGIVYTVCLVLAVAYIFTQGVI